MPQNNNDIVVLKDSKEANKSSLEVESGEIVNTLSPKAQAVTDLIESQTLRELQLVQALKFDPAEDHALLTECIHKLQKTALRLLDTDYVAIYAEKLRLHEAAANQLLDKNFNKDNPDLANLPITLPPLEDEAKWLAVNEASRAKACYALFKLLKDYIVERRKLSGQLYGASFSQGRQLTTTMSYKKAKLTGTQLLAQLPPSRSNSITSEPERILDNIFPLNAPNRSKDPKPKPAEEQGDRCSDFYQDDF